ncbi:hypothetical protein KR215_010227 [Drosophila sulfurigaster]|uniref:uncharacterized protein LOC133848668 n=1 Tax=Drosophila sulfurigaster albostrigata TaxID=89887 RepID=UPI002D21ED5A|nr:uncharacterized protein LOC133848668 [Drosophila sulfurigaster albostrigata]KAH8394122.1 hypothetical protein KR215_010227 [Drosophila sulfurigaster]
MAEVKGSKKRKNSSTASSNERTVENKQMFEEINKFAANLDIVEKDLNYAIAHSLSGLNTDDKIKLDTYLAYVNSTLFWMNLKLNGTDLSNHYILHDLRRAKEMLAREKEINDSLTAPRLDIAASKRFIASGMHTRFIEMDGIMVTKEQYQRSLAESASKN